MSARYGKLKRIVSVNYAENIKTPSVSWKETVIIMYRLRMIISKLLYGRNGIDSLFYGLFAVYALICIVNTFLRSSLLYFAGLAVLGYMIFRIFSKNISARRKESDWFTSKIKGIKYDRNHIFRKCPCCHTRLRLPRKRGTHTVCCPKCKVEFKVRTWF